MFALCASSSPFMGMAINLEDYNHQNQLCSSTFSHNLDNQKEHHWTAEIDHQSPPSTAEITQGDATIVKKLNHNASERDRRKKINFLYSSLRSLLPASDQMKKLSNPATVSRALKYIPELESQVKAKTKKKKELLSIFSRKLDSVCKEKQKISSVWRNLSAVSTSRLNDREIIIQISTLKSNGITLSHILLDLEEDGFSFLNATSHETFGGTIFYTIHLQVERSYIKSDNFSIGTY